MSNDIEKIKLASRTSRFAEEVWAAIMANEGSALTDGEVTAFITDQNELAIETTIRRKEFVSANEQVEAKFERLGPSNYAIVKFSAAFVRSTQLSKNPREREIQLASGLVGRARRAFVR